MTAPGSSAEWRLPEGCDQRLTPARPDLADAGLEGIVSAERYIRPRPARIAVPRTGLYPAPEPDARLDTEVVFGEAIDVYQERDGWLWVRSRTDGYVGYAAASAAAPPGPPPTHRVAARAALIFEAPDIKAPALRLPWPARVSVLETVPGAGTRGLLGRLAGSGFVPMAQLAPLASRTGDWVTAAEALMGQPYLWGGRSGDGVDCSSLVQLALATAHAAFPRDTDMQASCRLKGVSALPPDTRELARGDLVFWRGHVGIMQDATHLLHANAHHMAVASEPLTATAERIAAAEGREITTILRLDPDAMLEHLELTPPLG
ncbi:MAG: NlpC/P60 family protein [Pseudomonadota bacterium]